MPGITASRWDRDVAPRPEVLCPILLGITNIDPIRYQLLFERFLNPERVSMPDIDVDFCYRAADRRSLIMWCANTARTGWCRSSPSVRWRPRGVIRDVGRVMDLPYAFVDQHCENGPTGAEYHAWIRL